MSEQNIKVQLPYGSVRDDGGTLRVDNQVVPPYDALKQAPNLRFLRDDL